MVRRDERRRRWRRGKRRGEVMAVDMLGDEGQAEKKKQGNEVRVFEFWSFSVSSPTR